MGRMPTYDEVACGGVIERKTGRVSAGLNGQRTSRSSSASLASREPQSFGIAEFAPDLWSRLQQGAAKRQKIVHAIKPQATGTTMLQVNAMLSSKTAFTAPRMLHTLQSYSLRARMLSPALGTAPAICRS